MLRSLQSGSLSHPNQHGDFFVRLFFTTLLTRGCGGASSATSFSDCETELPLHTCDLLARSEPESEPDPEPHCCLSETTVRAFLAVGSAFTEEEEGIMRAKIIRAELLGLPERSIQTPLINIYQRLDARSPYPRQQKYRSKAP